MHTKTEMLATSEENPWIGRHAIRAARVGDPEIAFRGAGSAFAERPEKLASRPRSPSILRHEASSLAELFMWSMSFSGGTEPPPFSSMKSMSGLPIRARGIGGRHLERLPMQPNDRVR